MSASVRERASGGETLACSERGRKLPAGWEWPDVYKSVRLPSSCTSLLSSPLSVLELNLHLHTGQDVVGLLPHQLDDSSKWNGGGGSSRHPRLRWIRVGVVTRPLHHGGGGEEDPGGPQWLHDERADRRGHEVLHDQGPAGHGPGVAHAPEDQGLRGQEGPAHHRGQEQDSLDLPRWSP